MRHKLREVRAKNPDTTCIVEFLDESVPADRSLIDLALAFPDAMVASDALPVHLPDGTMDSRGLAAACRRLHPSTHVGYVCEAFTDHATYLDSTGPSTGVRHLLVAGTAVIKDGEIVPDAYPGQPLRAQPR